MKEKEDKLGRPATWADIAKGKVIYAKIKSKYMKGVIEKFVDDKLIKIRLHKNKKLETLHGDSDLIKLIIIPK